MMHHAPSQQAPEPGKVYRCDHNSTPLYRAEILRVEGCWATVRIVEALESPHRHLYSPGQEFQIKTAMYGFTEQR